MFTYYPIKKAYRIRLEATLYVVKQFVSRVLRKSSEKLRRKISCFKVCSLLSRERGKTEPMEPGRVLALFSLSSLRILSTRELKISCRTSKDPLSGHRRNPLPDFLIRI